MGRGERPRQSRIKRFVKNLIRINDSPKRIARGVAIGVFWGILPTFGLAIVFSIPTAFLLKANRLSAIVGTFVSNPLTWPFIYPFGFRIGQQILRVSPIDFSWGLFKLQSLLNLSKSLIVGSSLLAVGFCLLSYLVVLMAVARYRRRHTSGSAGS